MCRTILCYCTTKIIYNNNYKYLKAPYTKPVIKTKQPTIDVHQTNRLKKTNRWLAILTVNVIIDKPVRPCQDTTIYRRGIKMSRPHSSLRVRWPSLIHTLLWQTCHLFLQYAIDFDNWIGLGTRKIVQSFNFFGNIHLCEYFLIGVTLILIIWIKTLA